MQKPANTQHPINPLLANRWSGRAIDANKPISKEILLQLLEAARWAPSCANEQPWRFLVFTEEHPEALEKARSCLVPGNAWARKAPVLLLSVANEKWARDGSPNRFAVHDVGLASQNVALQASNLGLVLHFMGGYDAAKATELFNIPAGHQALAMIAVGYPGNPDELNEKQKEAELSPRTRKPLDEVAFFAGWPT
jgi:nitroreductase